MRYILAPAPLFAILWIGVLLLYQAKLSLLLQELRPETVFLVVGSVLAMVLGWVLVSCYLGRLISFRFSRVLFHQHFTSRFFVRKLKVIKYPLMLGICIEISAERGLPLLSAFGVGSQIDYVEYGIPVLHGLLNGLYLVFAVGVVARSLATHSLKFQIIVLLLIYPILILNRQMIVSILIQAFLLYVLYNRVGVKQFVVTLCYILGLILLFGFLGDFRTGREIILLLAQPSFDVPDYFPSGFVWFYSYITTPLNNVNANIDIEPIFALNELVSNLFPSVFRNMFFGNVDTADWLLVDRAFTVSSIFRPILMDIGYIGAPVLFFLLGIISSVIMSRSHKSLPAFFVLMIFIHTLALSFFFNLMTHIVIVFEMVVLAYLATPKKMAKYEEPKC